MGWWCYYIFFTHFLVCFKVVTVVEVALVECVVWILVVLTGFWTWVNAWLLLSREPAGDDALCLGNSCSTIAVVTSQSALFITAEFCSHPPLKLTAWTARQAYVKQHYTHHLEILF